MGKSTVEIPRGMMEEIEMIIREEKILGFESIEEFAREAIRASIVKYRPIP